MLQCILISSLVSCVLCAPVKQEYDYIVVGAGTAGSVVAACLSENPNESVLVLEAGKNTFDNSLMTVPSMWRNVQATPEYQYGYTTQPDPGANNRSLTFKGGKMLGGTCSLNVGCYLRGSRYDFDHWEELGNPGWSYNDVLPYFKKSEEVLNKKLADDEFHGTNGPWKTNYAFTTPIHDVLVDAAKEIGLQLTDDINGAQQENVGLSQDIVTKNGVKNCPHTSLLRPALGRPNIQLIVEAFVTKIRIEKFKATGVVYKKGKKSFIVRARKEVILCAGAANSPKLLMLSGIGPHKHLDNLGIKVVSDLPVGSTLFTHPYLPLEVSTNITAPQWFTSETLFQYIFQGTGVLTAAGVQTLMFFRTKTQPPNNKAPFVQLFATLKTPVFSQELQDFIQNGTAIPQELLDTLINGQKDNLTFMLGLMLLHPRSAGTYRLRSRDPHDPPVTTANFLTNEDDNADFIEAIRLMQKLIGTDEMKNVDTKLLTPPVSTCINHVFDTDEYWRCQIPNIVIASGHWTSPCLMGPHGVVNADLRVKGVKNLRVIDASVMPTTISGHTMAATVMIAEKGADLIKSAHSAHKYIIYEYVKLLLGN